MTKLLKFLISQIVDKPEAVEVAETTDETGTVILTATVDPADMGKVIGKGGKIISAIRELLKVKAIKQNRRVRVVLAEPPASAGQATQTDSLSPQSSPAPPEETS